MSLKKQERDLLKKAEEEDLIRLVRHFRVEDELGEPETVKLEDKDYRKTRAVTFVTLLSRDYDGAKEDFYQIEHDEDMNKFIEKYEDNADVYGIGYAICDRRDNFNKTLGRLIATGRAYKN